ncbi:MAG TPA: sulfatase, partial [Verrucomicrobiae bacterium]|nr:sulfatase [Verrucomicrobiae bacterium]
MNCNHTNFGLTRRDFFGRFAFGMGGIALAGLFQQPGWAVGREGKTVSPYQGLPDFPNFAPK